MKKKILSILLLAVLVFSVTACGSNESKNKSNTSKDNAVTSKELTVDDLSIDDFKWEMYDDDDEEHTGSGLYFTNNSKYDVIGLDISYKVKSDLSYDDLYKGFRKYENDYGSLTELVAGGEIDTLIKKGEKLDFLKITVDYSLYYYLDDGQMELMEPKELKIGVVNGSKLYHATYDFELETWELDPTTIVVNSLPDEDKFKAIPKPVGEYFVLMFNRSDYGEIYSYGITKETYDKYIKSLQSAGFESEPDSSTFHFEGDKDKYRVTAGFKVGEGKYGVNEEKMEIRVEIREYD